MKISLLLVVSVKIIAKNILAIIWTYLMDLISFKLVTN